MPVTEFHVNGNTLLPADQIQAALVPFRGDRTMSDLRQAARVVQDLYAQAGYGGVVAYLPPQQLNNGLVQIDVIEGHLAQVRIAGNRQFDDASIRASLPALVLGQTPRIRELDTQIELANENPARQTRVLLQPGVKPGEVEARVSVREEPVQRWTLGLDTTGNTHTGRARASVGWRDANLSGRDDVASVQWQTAPANPSRVNVLAGGYHLPMYARSLVLDAYAAYSDVDNGTATTPVGDLQFNGRGRALGMRLGRPLAAFDGVTQRLFAGLDYRAYLNQCSITGLPAGACGTAGESVAVQPLALEYLLRSGGTRRWLFSVGVQHNLQLGGGLSDSDHFAAVRPGANPHYTVLRLNGSLVSPLGDALELNLRGAGQWTSNALVPGEQFGVGGMASVRGYEERELTGDRGAFLSIEAAGPPWSLPRALGQWNALAFVDGGWVSNRLGTPCQGTDTNCRITGAGVGARLSAGNLQARLDIASALDTGPQTERGHARAHASVTYSF